MEVYSRHVILTAIIPERSCSSVSYESLFKQEPYMEGVNPFIKNNKHRMIMFLDELGVSERLVVFWLPELSYSSANSVCCACRTSLISLKPLSTLGQTCPETWPRCTRSVPHIRTSCGRLAMRGERSRSEAGHVTSWPCYATFSLNDLIPISCMQHVLKKLLAITELLQQKQAQYAMSNSNR